MEYYDGREPSKLQQFVIKLGVAKDKNQANNVLLVFLALLVLVIIAVYVFSGDQDTTLPPDYPALHV